MTCADHPTRIMHDPSRGAELRKVPRTRPCNLACDSTVEMQSRLNSCLMNFKFPLKCRRHPRPLHAR